MVRSTGNDKVKWIKPSKSRTCSCEGVEEDVDPPPSLPYVQEKTSFKAVSLSTNGSIGRHLILAQIFFFDFHHSINMSNKFLLLINYPV